MEPGWPVVKEASKARSRGGGDGVRQRLGDELGFLVPPGKGNLASCMEGCVVGVRIGGEVYGSKVTEVPETNIDFSLRASHL